MRVFGTIFGIGLLATVAVGATQSGGFHFPRIADYGGIVVLPDAAEQPRAGAKVVFDAARYLNLHAQAGHAPTDVKLALVLHGQATNVALKDDAYVRVTGAKANPNRELLAKLKSAGVEINVCGQSLARNKYPAADVAPAVTVAVSAMTVNVNKQRDGYAYLAIH